MNVGVLLFRPEPHFIGTRVSSSNQRIRRFFGSEDNDWEQINTLKASIGDRFESEGEQFRTLEALEHFIATRGNEIQLTQPRPVKIVHPEQDLELLYRRLVGDPIRRNIVPPFFERLGELLAHESIARFIRRAVTVSVPAFHRPLTVPFGFQNGRLNLIQPTTFRPLSPSRAITRACRLAVEGRSLFEHPDESLGKLQLLVVGDFAPAQPETQAVVRDIFDENEVRLFSLANLPLLLEEIQTTGKVLTA